MAGNKRSGPRGFKDFAPSTEAPRIGSQSSYAEIEDFIGWVVAQQTAGLIDRADARELRDHAKALVTAKRAEFAEYELEHAKGILADLEETDRRVSAKIAEARRMGINLDETGGGTDPAPKKRSPN